MGKIIKRNQIEEALKDYKQIVSTNGCFDVIHVGHTRLLKEARAMGDVLIVCVNTDESVRRLKRLGRPLTPVAERAEILASLEAVDYVVPFPEIDACAVLEIIKPAIHVKGDDYTIEQVIERGTVERNGGEVRLIKRTIGTSSSHLVAQLGTSEERVHVGFNLMDRVTNRIVAGEEAINTGICLTPDSRLVRHSVDGDRPLLVSHDVTKRYGLMAKVATG